MRQAETSQAPPLNEPFVSPDPSAPEGGDARSRLLEAMRLVAAREGCSGASVARVSAAAGVSRVTFYRHFANRDDCFLACCREATDGFYARVCASVEKGVSGSRPWAVLEALLREVQADPTTARLILLAALGGPASSRCEYEALSRRLERLLQADRPHRWGGRRALWISTEQLVGATLVIASIRVLLGRVEELGSLNAELAAWVDSYAVLSAEPPPGGELWVRLGRQLTISGGPRLHPARAVENGSRSRRDRLIEATAEVTARVGFAGLRVSDIVTAARVRRAAFYAEFRDKQDAFRAVQVLNLQRAIAAAAEQFSLGGTWPDRVWRGLAALHAYMGAHPEEAYLALGEVYAAGEEAMRLSQHSRGAFSMFLEEGYRERAATGLPTLCLETIGAAIYSLMRRTVAAGEARRMPELLPQTAYIALAPFVGPREALAFVQLKVRGGDREVQKAPAGLSVPLDRAGTDLVAGLA